MATVLDIAVIPGDGIGVEVTAEALKDELRAAGFRDVAARGFLLGTIALHVGVR